ncbi:MAG TPA: hypothetical protein VHC18_09295 [Amycolatopsis sp.]|nr:hypothetical protein [Amycolatopsis sp.]
MSIQHKQVTVEGPDGTQVSVTYPGILLVGYEDDVPVGERWIPFGEDPTEEDDERLIEALHTALLWQQHEATPECDT